MRALVFFILAILTLSAAHACKMLRWKQFVEVYEKPHLSTLLSSLAIGYVINFVLPFRVIGDIVRSMISGRKMKNGVTFSLSTVFLDRYLDVLTMAVIFTGLYAVGLRDTAFADSTVFYLLFALALILLSFILLNFSRAPKLLIQKTCSVFNSKIELNLLLFFWSLISSFKDMFRKLSRKKLLGYTGVMWLLYITSYYFFSKAASGFLKIKFYLSDTILMLFSKDSYRISAISLISSRSFFDLSVFTSVYMLSSLVILLVVSLIIRRKNIEAKPEKLIHLLPQIDEASRLNFLKLYFAGDKREYIADYLNMNRDVNVVKDLSAGSNATTILCMDGKSTFFRKYAFGADADKLYEQIVWMREHEETLPLAEILSVKHEDKYCCYDMAYEKDAVGLFEYVHSVSAEAGWQMIESVLDAIHDNLHTKNVSKASEETLAKYIHTKVGDNLEKIRNAKYLQPLLPYDNLVINGVTYHNLGYFGNYLSFEYLHDVFKDDVCSDIHGDLTIENVICRLKTDGKPPFYIIDPNTGNLHNAPPLDYGKLLQSLHGDYEFLMKTDDVGVEGNRITYLDSTTAAYRQLYESYKAYLFRKFSRGQARSIFYHEVVHWLRLMPYKINKNGKRSVLFYAGTVKVLNDVVAMFGEEAADEKEISFV